MNTAITYEDIIFSGKNKSYGAYQLRREYKRNVFIALTVTLLIFSVSISSPLLLKKNTGNVKWENNKTGVILLPPPTNADNKMNDPVPVALPPVKPMIKFQAPIIIKDELATDTYFPTVSDLINMLPGLETIEGDKNGVETITELPEIPVQEKTTESKPFLWAEEMPVYSKGEGALLEYFAQNVRYPEIAKRAGIEGKVTLSFVVEKDGSLSDIIVVKGIGGGCDEEAIRVLRSAGKWIAGKQNGNAVRVSLGLGILFKLN